MKRKRKAIGNSWHEEKITKHTPILYNLMGISFFSGGHSSFFKWQMCFQYHFLHIERNWQNIFSSTLNDWYGAPPATFEGRYFSCCSINRTVYVLGYLWINLKLPLRGFANLENVKNVFTCFRYALAWKLRFYLLKFWGVRWLIDYFLQRFFQYSLQIMRVRVTSQICRMS